MLLDPPPTPITETSLATYFSHRLTRYAKQLRPQPHDDTCWYLGNLLERFTHSEQLFTWQDGHMSVRPLALIYGDAVQANSERERCLHLRQLGDLSLFMGALFPDKYARHGIRRDYFVGMGGGAYDYLAENARQNRHIFAELARTFVRMLEMIAKVCSRSQPSSAADILALYERWAKTSDKLAEKQLHALGIELDSNRQTH